MKMLSRTAPTGLKRASIDRTRRRAWVLCAVVAALGLGACTGPSNPEPIMLNTQVISIHGEAPDTVNLVGDPGATEGAVLLRVINLDGLTAAVVPVEADGAFAIQLPGVPMERFRIIAESEDGRYATAVVSSDGVSPDVIDVAEDLLGCLYADTALLDLGEAVAGEPVYGEITVTNDCVEPRGFLGVSTDSPYFTPASLLMVPGAPLEPGESATVSITYLSPGGEDEGLLILEPELLEPEQAPLVVALRGRASP